MLFECWDHRAHVKVAYLILQECHSLEEALERMRNGVKAYNAANDVPEGPLSGYNETTTHAFLHIMQATIEAYGELFPVASADEFCDTHPQIMTSKLLRLYYSPERCQHPDAKTRFVEPDLAPLPKRSK